jgi:myo-inositol oxygenase
METEEQVAAAGTRPLTGHRRDFLAGHRRDFLIGSIAAVGGAVAGALAYRELVPRDKRFAREFLHHSNAILGKHYHQTSATVAALKAKYETPVFGKARVWDLIQKLSLCVDETDASLFCTSQLIHVQQVLEGIERDGIQDHDLLIAALIHDVGKVLLLTGELPENVVGLTGRISESPQAAGLDHVVFQFGHGEMVYSRFKDHVPEHLAWLLRYHGTDMADLEPFLSQKDREYRDRYLIPFHKYDGGTKSYNHLPKVQLAKYRDLIEATFPQPILF